MDRLGAGLSRRTFVLGSLAAGASFAVLGSRGFTTASASVAASDGCVYVPWTQRTLLTEPELDVEVEGLAAQGFRPVDVTGYDVERTARYTAVFEQRQGPPVLLTTGHTKKEFRATLKSMVSDGYRLVRFCGYVVAAVPYFAAIWEQRSDGIAWAWYYNQSSEALEATESKLKPKGYRLVDLSGYALNGQAYFATLYDTSASDGWAWRVDMTEDSLTSPHIAPEGFRLAHLSAYGIQTTPYYAAIWEKSAGPAHLLTTVLDRSSFLSEIDERRYRGFRPVRVAGFDIRRDDRYATVWARGGISEADETNLEGLVDDYRAQAGLPGLSLAFAKDGRLVYARGFGLADPDANEFVTVRSRFRIASASKSVTAVAIMRLIEQGRLDIDGRVFGEHTGILGRDYGSVFPYPEKVRKVTVRHLLTHTAGGWENEPPAGVAIPQDVWDEWRLMFGPAYNEMDQAELLGEVLDHSGQAGHPLELRNEPGTVFGYSGFSYFVLGRIIDKLTGSYEEFVRNEILDPESTMAIAGNTLDEAQSNEVVYLHDDRTPSDADGPYEIDVRRSDATGGWIASAIDLVGFMTKVDGESLQRPDVFDDDSYRRQMISASEPSLDDGAPFPYGMGWLLDLSRPLPDGTYPTYYGAGSLAGTNSAMARIEDGGSVYCVAGIVNKRNRTSDLAHPFWLEDFRKSITSWPCLDLTAWA